MTIADIAKMAGVSAAAVSRYFNNGYLSEEKKDAIKKVVEETGYRPSFHAQNLRTQKTKIIGVIVPKMASQSIGNVVEGILSALDRNDYRMLLAVTRSNPEKELEYLETFDQKKVDGVILVASVFTPRHRQILKKMTVPVVIVGQRLPGFHSVFHDDYHAIYDMTKQVIRQGRKKLGYIGALMEDHAVGEERLRGYQDALEDLGAGTDLMESIHRFVVADFTVQSGYEMGKVLLEKAPDLDGIICATDEMAAGVMRYLMEQKKRVPEDVLLTGHGDSDLSHIATPSIPTIHFYYEKSGDLAVEKIIAMLDERETGPKEVCLEYEIHFSC